MLRVILFLLFITAGVYFLWFSRLSGFELPEEGIFMGTGQGAAVVVRPYGSEKAHVWLSDVGGSPVEVLGDSPVFFSQGLEARGERLSGSLYGLEIFENGKFKERIKLEASSVAIPLLSADELSEIKLRLAKQLEYEELKRSRQTIEENEKIEKAEIEKLTGFLSDGGLLRESSSRRLERERALLNQAERDFKDAEAELRKMNRQVELAYRVTGMGKLVSLSRESLERERRWIGSLLKVNVPEISEEIVKKSDQALEILELKKQIDIENGKIYELLNLTGER